MQGRIRRVIRGRGFGFIAAEGRQFFFHHSEVRETPFKRLEAGDLVEFEALDGPDGRNPRARDVRVVAKRRASPVALEPARDAGANGEAEPRGPRVFSGVWPIEGEAPEPFGGESDPPAGPSVDGSLEEDADADLEPAEDDPEFVDAVERTASASPGAPAGTRRARPRTAERRGRRDRGGSGRSRGSARRAAGRRAEGVVRNIDLERGFGFIRTRGGDVFFDRAAARGSFEGLSVGSRVRFTFASAGRRSKAADVSPI